MVWTLRPATNQKFSHVLALGLQNRLAVDVVNLVRMINYLL
jgi:hypothetical protein